MSCLTSDERMDLWYQRRILDTCDKKQTLCSELEAKLMRQC